MANPRQGARPLIAKAAQTIAQSMGLDETMFDVLRARAFEPYSEGLRQYLTIQLRSVEEGAQAFQELRTIVAGFNLGELVRPPGMRANLFSLARQIIRHHWEEGDGAAFAGVGQLAWRKPGYGVEESYLHSLEQIRKELPASDAELLELRYARELEQDELAHVLEIKEDQVGLKLEMALAQVRCVLGGTWKDPATSLDTLLLETFAIEPSVSPTSDQQAERTALLAQGAILARRYQIQEEVGTGSMGSVYRALDTEVPGHVVALKMLHNPSHSKEARDAALRELHLIASVFHPSVVQFKDHGWFENRLWFVMPWYEGESLQDRIDRRPLTRSEARTIFEQLAFALSAMHSAGIRHQDIKPDNIFLARIEGAGDSKQMLPVLLDLGVAAKEAELVLAGTPIYFAPEVAAQYARVAEPHPVTPAADVFSLCLSLRNALEPSSREDVAAGAVERFIENRARNSPKLPHDKEFRYLKGYFERWLSIDPEQRPTAAELADEFVILTAPEDRRARRVALIRWLGPLLLALVAVFGSAVYGLSRQAELRKVEAAAARLETEQAKLETAEAQEDLSEAEERQRQLKQDIAETLERYRSSVMTREQLTGKLASAEGQLRMLQEMFSFEQQRTRFLRGQLNETKTERDQLNTDLTQTRGALDSERSTTKRLTSQLETLEERLTTTSERVDEAENAVAGLTRQLESKQSELESERRAKTALAERVEAAERALEGAQTELAQAQGRIAELERQIAQLRNAGGGSGDGNGSDAGASGKNDYPPTGKAPAFKRLPHSRLVKVPTSPSDPVRQEQ